ncbi:hypothetical protein [Photobacterium atrarenae]|uniref:Uncharacterized protein n=1 Tax=Photobacterium atrarenae TaxID=865757 RepID=A0ABY5GH59_9GAMM|nr:hypothetical protein [Photobacterium atrarenae]UTV28454.1 hypothetical protein NNL38_04190 [Photobacterium atrarenae]
MSSVSPAIKAIIALMGGVVIGTMLHWIIPQSFSQQFYSNTSVYIPVANNEGVLIDLTLGLELKEERDFYMYVANPQRQLGVTITGPYEFTGGKLSLYSEQYERVLPDDEVTLFDHFFTHGETFAKKNMDMLSLNGGVLLFLDRTAFYLVDDEAKLGSASAK